MAARWAAPGAAFAQVAIPHRKACFATCAAACRASLHKGCTLTRAQALYHTPPPAPQWGVSTDEALLAVNDGIITNSNKWNLPPGLVVK